MLTILGVRFGEAAEKKPRIGVKGMKLESYGPSAVSKWVVLSLLLTASVTHAEKQILAAVLKKVDVEKRTIKIELENQFLEPVLNLEPNAIIELNQDRAELRDLKPGMKITITGDLKKNTCSRVGAKVAVPLNVEVMPNPAAAPAVSGGHRDQWSMSRGISHLR